jgi:hypothetical protein
MFVSTDVFPLSSPFFTPRFRVPVPIRPLQAAILIPPLGAPILIPPLGTPILTMVLFFAAAAQDEQRKHKHSRY